MALFRISSPYGRMYSAFYDHFVSPAVFRVFEDDLHRTFAKRISPGARILDIGCGGGQHAIELAGQRPDVQVVGVDLSAEFVRRARLRASAAQLGSRVEFVEGNALALPFEAEEFDHVYSIGSIKHWPDMGRGLAECVRVLKPGGQLLVGEADRGCRFPDVVTWTRDSRVPRPLQIVLHLYFRTFVAGQSIDLDDARQLWTSLSLAEPDGPRRIPGTPGLVMAGCKA
jgi:ubiquinone/menaquinone biosynthesis C-methylase UbiE